MRSVSVRSAPWASRRREWPAHSSALSGVAWSGSGTSPRKGPLASVCAGRPRRHRRPTFQGRVLVVDRAVLETALRKAISSGASAVSPIYSSNLASDLDIVRTHTDVGIEQEAFNAYVSEIERDPQIASFQGAFATSPFGGGVSVGIAGFGRLLLAEAISSGDVPETVKHFRAYVEKNSAPVIAVMAVSGVRVDQEVQLGPDIRLVPMASLPPSIQRGAALGQPISRVTGSDGPIPSALTTELEYGPIFYRPAEGGIPSEEARLRVSTAIDALGQARCLLSLLGPRAAYRQSWIQPKSWLTSLGLGTGSLISLDNFFGTDAAIDVMAVEKLAASYFKIDGKLRHAALRIPLDRLDRANGFRDLADTAIDLGIAFEALLLHDLNNSERGELSFRLSLRGAWLLGRDEIERRDVKRVLRDIYDLRSRAVHSGMVERTGKNWHTISRGRDLCRQLILRTIDAKANVDWNRLVLGGQGLPEPSTPTSA